MAHNKLTDSQVEEPEIERNEPPPVETPEADQQQQPPPQEPTQTPQDAADFVAEINAKNEIRDLLGSYFSRDSRVLILDRNNRHKQVVVSPPETQTLKDFVVEAKKSKWIESMLHKKHYMAGMLTYLAKVAPDIYVQIADDNRLDLVKAVPTIVTLSMASYLGLNDTQLELLRSWLRNECDLNLEYSGTELKRIDREAGVSTENEPTCDTYDYYRDDKDPETCRYWNSDLGAEIGVETDIHISHLFREAKDKGIELTEIPTLDYSSPGLPDGCTMLLGGDHGDHCFRFQAKMHFSSPQERKEREELSHQCPMIQTAHVDCTKDWHDLLAETTMPKLFEHVRTMQK
jgi:hypothetical protein